MATFPERLTELIAEKEIKSHELADVIGVNITTINDWKRGKYQVHLTNAIKLADFFACSLEYLMGRIEHDVKDFKPRACPPFYSQFLAVLKQRDCTTYRLRKDTSISGGHFDSWKTGNDPLVITLITIAEYLDITLDFLVGREY